MNIFPLTESPYFFKNKMLRATTKEEKYDVLCELGGACCYAVYTYMNSSALHSGVPELLRKLDKVARSIVLASEGIEEGYRLSDYWLHTLFTQIIMEESPTKERYETAIKNIKQLFTKIGWNYKEAFDPLHDSVNRLYTIEFARKYTPEQEVAEAGQATIVLFPTSPNPIGSVWRAKNGNEYTYIGDNDYEARQESRRGIYEIVKPTEYQLSKWERIK